MQETDWESRYQNSQTGWDRGNSSQNLFYWLDNDLLSKGKILVPGCGNGYEILTLADKGYDVTGVDIAPTPISNLKAALKRANLSATLIQADFLEWHPEKQFDAIYEQTSLCALPSELWQSYADQLHSWLKPKGKIFAQFMQRGSEGGPPYHCEISNMRDVFSEDNWIWSKQYAESSNDFDALKELLYILKKR